MRNFSRLYRVCKLEFPTFQDQKNSKWHSLHAAYFERERDQCTNRTRNRTPQQESALGIGQLHLQEQIDILIGD